MSDLHKQNLQNWRQQHSHRGDGGSSGSGSSIAGLQYRDRAKERRAKFGEADDPKPNKLKQKYLQAMEDAESKGLPEQNIGSDNIGSKMLQKMGWKEGLGLGKANQGRTQIVEVCTITRDRKCGNFSEICYPYPHPDPTKTVIQHCILY